MLHGSLSAVLFLGALALFVLVGSVLGCLPTPRRVGLVLALLLLAGLAGFSVQARPARSRRCRRLCRCWRGRAGGWRLPTSRAGRWATASGCCGTARDDGAALPGGHGAGAGDDPLERRVGVSGGGLSGAAAATAVARAAGRGRRHTVDVATLGRVGDRLLVASAVVSPDGSAARGTDDLLRTAWEVLWGTAGPYDLVRLSVPEGGGVAAERWWTGCSPRCSRRFSGSN